MCVVSEMQFSKCFPFSDAIYADILDEVSKRRRFGSRELVVLVGSKHSFGENN